MVLVGHSMGGLVSKLQTVDSGDAFWQTTSDHPFAELKADDDVTRSLANAYFFDPSPSVRRVVTIGTPHRGSQFANGTTRWLGHKLITLPAQMLHGRQQLLALNKRLLPARFADRDHDQHRLARARFADAAGAARRHARAVGVVPQRRRPRARPGLATLVRRTTATASCRSPVPGSTTCRSSRSQIVVPADHVNVHRHPQSILEVRRVLFEQLAELQNFPGGPETGSCAQRAAAI